MRRLKSELRSFNLRSVFLHLISEFSPFPFRSLTCIFVPFGLSSLNSEKLKTQNLNKFSIYMWAKKCSSTLNWNIDVALKALVWGGYHCTRQAWRDEHNEHNQPCGTWMVPALTPLMTSQSRFSFSLYSGSHRSTGRRLSSETFSPDAEHLTQNIRNSLKVFWLSLVKSP